MDGTEQDRLVHTALLRTLLHDLLTPLTAIRWNSELLVDKHAKMERERLVRSLNDIHDSSILGISIAHKINSSIQILDGRFARQDKVHDVGETVAHACYELVPQYERHGVTLECQSIEKGELTLDPNLVDTLTWAFLKYMLSMATAGATVHVTLRTYAEKSGWYELAGVLEQEKSGTLQVPSDNRYENELKSTAVYAGIVRSVTVASVEYSLPDELGETDAAYIRFGA